MNNLSRIKRVSQFCHFLLTFTLIVLPIFEILVWVFINDKSGIFEINIAQQNHANLTVDLQIIGFLISLLPLASLMYIVITIRKLFSFYKNGIIFSLDQVLIFKKIAKGMVFWIIFSIINAAALSVIFSWNNPEGERFFSISLNSDQVAILIISLIILVISWVMDEGRILSEENKLII
jgi:hypothetical protein